MIKKIRNLAGAIIENKNRLSLIEQQNKIIEGLLRESNWANIFNSAISGSTWFNNIPLNVGRWAANYSLFYILYRILDEVKPENILELGLGETTKMIQAYKQFHNKNASCTTIEQSNEWIEIKLKSGISKEYVNIMQVNLEEKNIKGFSSLLYKDLAGLLAPEGKKFNLVVIDGPWGSDNFSRYNVIDLVDRQLIDDEFIIIVDDYNREGEQQTFEDLKQVLAKHKGDFKTSFYSGDKTQSIITCKKFGYLCSL
ncbi:MAG: hypothetical protein M3Z26_08240 [Bacteroidota bacterium]|nr:hypothetical protein [Bacteroidota bacterium]